MSNLFEHCRTRVSSTKSKIRKVERRSKRQLDYAETEYLRRSQSTNKRVQCQIFVEHCRAGVSTVHHGMAALAPRRPKPPQTSPRKYAGGRSSRRNPCRISSQDDDCQSSSWAKRGEAWEATAFLSSYRTQNGNDSDTTKNPARDVPDETGKDERRVNYQATRPAGRRLDRRSSFFRYLPSSVTL